MPKAINIFVIMLLCIQPVFLEAQLSTLGTPFVKNYSRSDYQAGSQNWDIQQGSNGMMYFANNKGLLEFDGYNWNTFALPNSSVLRSIMSSNEGIIYAGGFNELGYYEIGENGGAIYHSLLDLLPEDEKDFDEIWNIYEHLDGIIFQSFSQIMIYKGKQIEVIPAPTSFHFSFMLDNEYYVNDMKEGLMRYAMGSLYPLKGFDKLKGTQIWGVLPIENKLLVATASEGTFLYDGNSLSALNNESTDFLKTNQIYTCRKLNADRIAYGTIQNGLLICDLNGKPIQHISISDGLQNNTILSMAYDKFGNLWLGTDYGIDYLQLNSPLLQLSANYGLSTGYAAAISRGSLYLGTNQGLFVQSISSINSSLVSNKELSLIEETKGQVWTLNDINGSLFCGHNNGTYIIEGSNASRISDIPGGWTFLEVPKKPTRVIGGTYKGLSLYEKKMGKWTYVKQFEGFYESARTMVFDDDGSLWMTHGYKGIYHFYFNDNYDSIININYYNSADTILNTQVHNLVKIGEKILFTTNRGILYYDKNDDKFKKDQVLNELFGDDIIRTIKRDENNNLWYFNDEKTGVYRIGEEGNYIDVLLPFMDLQGEFVKSFEMVYPFDDENVLFGTENGFVHYNPLFKKDYKYEFTTYINSMLTFNPDSVFVLNSNIDNGKISLEYANNNVEFNFSANDFEHTNKIEYSTFLDGYDKQWSDWQVRNTKEYTNLDEGKYIFKVKAKNNNLSKTKTVELLFYVKPPFHRSAIAYFLYTCLFMLFVSLMVFWIKKRFRRLKLKNQKEQEEVFRKKEEKLQRETLQAEKEIIRLRNEKLREGIKVKDKELANSTIQMLHKNEMLITLRDELKKLSDVSKDENHKHEVKHMVRKINKEIDNENQWNLFEIHFESVHEEFLKRIKIAYPELTPRELKLCAYLRMNISSKEISVLMNISTRGVEISRYRLRKKLKLQRETNLTDFVLSF